MSWGWGFGRGWFGRGWGRGFGWGARLGYCPWTGLPRGWRWWGAYGYPYNYGYGYNYGYPYGYGYPYYGYDWGYPQQPPAGQDELTALKQEAEYLENELQAIRQRIAELEKQQENQ